MKKIFGWKSADFTLIKSSGSSPSVTPHINGIFTPPEFAELSAEGLRDLTMIIAVGPVDYSSQIVRLIFAIQIVLRPLLLIY